MKTNLFFKCYDLADYIEWLESEFSGRDKVIKQEGIRKAKEPKSHRVIGRNSLDLRRYDYSNKNFTGWKAA